MATEAGEMPISAKGTLIHILTSNRWSGVERYSLDVCSHFRSEGWHIIVLTRGALAVDTPFIAKGFQVEHAPLAGSINIGSVMTLKKLLQNVGDGPVIVHAHNSRGALRAVIAKKISHGSHARLVMTRHKVKKGIDSWLSRYIYSNLDAIIFVSSIAKNRFLSGWQSKPAPVKEENLHVIHNSLNIIPDELPSPPTHGITTAMFHGRLQPGKGLETLIDSLAILKGIKLRLRIVGSGSPDYTDRLRRRAINRGVMEAIDWHRHVEDPLPLIEECDLGVTPSVAEEAFGLANIEYMVCGRPIVSTSNGAQPEYITDGREGLLVPPANPVALAEAIRSLATDSKLRHRMGERAYHSFCAKLSWPNFIIRLKKAYGISTDYSKSDNNIDRLLNDQ